jgi:hypothetical protein
MEIVGKKIGLVDDSFRHYPYSAVLGEVPSFFEWDRLSPFAHGIVVFTNENILSESRESIPRSSRIAWLQESKGILGHLYKNVESVISEYQIFLTHDSKFLQEFENAYFLPGGGVYIGNSFGGGIAEVTKKTRMCSIVSSFKRTTPMHEIRNAIAKKMKSLHDTNFEVFGGSPYLFDYLPIFQTLRDFRFSIVVENTLDDYYFTEKILNCFATGTVPIYMGARKISNFFNINGIIPFHSVRQLYRSITPILSTSLYEEMMPAILENFELVKNFRCTEDYVWREYLNKP